METLLTLEKVGIKFGGVIALKDIDLVLNYGEILALIGPNGAGKTTLFNILTGIYKPTSGIIIYKGKQINQFEPFKRVRMGIARTFQNPRLIRGMTVLENVEAAHPFCNRESLFRSIFLSRKWNERRRNTTDECKRVLEEVGLKDKLDVLAGDLPYGERRLLEIARALITKCGLLLLDEPAAGMNKQEKDKLIDLIRLLSRKFRFSIILIEHDINLVISIADRIIVLDHGEKISEGTGPQVQSDPKVINAYLGEEDETLE